jgi:pimeloyl-ACP methyl ester carboxylesterase
MWKEHVLPTADLPLAYYEAGDGPVVVFLHGGPEMTTPTCDRSPSRSVGSFAVFSMISEGLGILI